MERVKKLFKKLIILGISAAMLFSLVACNAEKELVNYKSDQKTEIQNYAGAKGEDNYSADNWIILNEFITTGNTAIDAAEDKPAVDIAVFETKLAIDGVAPKESDIMKNGAYFITDASWEKYVRNCAKGFGEDEVWIQDVINGGDGGNWSQSLNPRTTFWIAVLDEKMTVSINDKVVYQISKVNELYHGQLINVSITFWLIDDILYIRNGSETKQYRRDSSYQESEKQPLQLSAPVNVELNIYGFRWQYPDQYPPAGFCCGGIDIRYPETQDFLGVTVVGWVPPPYYFFDINFSVLHLMQGTNIIRIYNIGGPYLSRKEKQIYSSINSEYVIFNLIVDAEGNITIEE